MLHDILIFLAGLALIIAGGNYFTDGAAALARRLSVSELVIGLTIVALGSSAPDFVVCLTSTISGNTQIALGDVVGSNIFDILFAVGFVALIRPISVSRGMMKVDVPMLALSSLCLFFCGDDILFDGASADVIDRTDGLMFLCFFVLFTYFTFNAARNPCDDAPDAADHPDPTDSRKRPLWFALTCIAGGLAALIFGGNMIVSGASSLATRTGLSQSVIGLTIVAFGNAAPDLATSLIAALKNKPGIALGNVIGACVFNTYFILGVCATMRPLESGTITVVDFSVLAAASLLLWLFCRIIGTRIITRAEGAVLAAGYLGYMTYLVANALH